MVCWSGGLDSTYLIQKLLEENPNNVIYTNYIELINNPIKTKMELEAIDKMSSYFNQRWSGRFYNYGVAARFELKQFGKITGFYQMPIWISSIVSSVSDDINQVAIGYVMNDDAISYLDDVRNIIKAFNGICVRPLPEVIFPLYKTKKEDIAVGIHDELRQHVVCCENPSEIIDKDTKKINGYEACGKCLPCKRNPIVDIKKDIGGIVERPLLSAPTSEQMELCLL